MGLHTLTLLFQQYPCLRDIINSKNKPIVLGWISEPDSEVMLRQLPADCSKGSRLASHLLLVFVKDKHIGYLFDSDRGALQNTFGGHSIFHYEMNDRPPFMGHQTKAFDVHAGTTKNLANQRQSVGGVTRFYAEICHNRTFLFP